MAKEIYLVYVGDAWLFRSSLVLAGVYDDLDKAIGDIIESMHDDLAFLDDEHTPDKARTMLEELHQTQGFEYNYLIEVANFNAMFRL